MKLHLKVVRFINFMSFGNQWHEIELDKFDTTLVVGKNGSGKSSAILDVISFALFNKPFRNINKPQLANSITNKQCIVELEFAANGHQFVVRRGIKPDLFEIYKNDELVSETADTRDYQRAFEKYILKVNHKTFCQVVMLGSAIFIPFMSLQAQDRRNVIEDLLDLKIFSRMNTLLKTKITDIEKTISQRNTEKQILEDRINITNQHIKELQESNEVLIIEKTKIIEETRFNITTITANIASLNEEILQLSSKTKGLDKLNSKMSELKRIEHQLQHKVSQIDKEITFLTSNDVCPTCSQNIEEDFKIRTMTNKSAARGEVNTGVEKLKIHLDQTDAKLKAIGEIQNQIYDKSKKISEFQNSIKFYTRAIQTTEEEISRLQQRREEIDTSKLTEWKMEFDRTRSELIELDDDRTVMGYATNMLKDSGIKSKIIKTYIPIINQLIQKYLAILDFFVEFNIDEQFKEKIKSRFRDEFSYESFSEGEKARLNLAILFAWRALAKLRGSIDCNLIIFDEILDGSLDAEGTDNFVKLISQLTNQENLIIISHKEGAYDEKFSRILRFEKHKNFSHLVQT